MELSCTGDESASSWLSASSFNDFLDSIKIPTMVLIGTLALAVTIVVTEAQSTAAAASAASTYQKPSILRRLFPYLACIGGFRPTGSDFPSTDLMNQRSCERKYANNEVLRRPKFRS